MDSVYTWVDKVAAQTTQAASNAHYSKTTRVAAFLQGQRTELDEGESASRTEISACENFGWISLYQEERSQYTVALATTASRLRYEAEKKSSADLMAQAMIAQVHYEEACAAEANRISQEAHAAKERSDLEKQLKNFRKLIPPPRCPRRACSVGSAPSHKTAGHRSSSSSRRSWTPAQINMRLMEEDAVRVAQKVAQMSQVMANTKKGDLVKLTGIFPCIGPDPVSLSGRTVKKGAKGRVTMTFPVGR